MSRREQGFSLFECTIAACVLLVVITVSYSHYQSLVVEAEQAAFKSMVSWLNAGINLTINDAYSRGQLDDVDELHGSNPMNLVNAVMTTPSNYLGELKSAKAQQVPPAHWYYDLDQRRLVYHVRYTENLDGLMVANQRIHFQLQVQYPLPNNNANLLSGRLRLVTNEQDFWQSPLGFGRPPQQTINDYELAQWANPQTP